MVKYLKMGIRMMRYSYNVKANVVMGIAYAILGIVLSLLEGTISIYGGYFMLCASLLPVQMIYSVSVSNMFLASPARKQMQTVIPVVVGVVGALVVYLIVVLRYGIEVLGNAELINRVCSIPLIMSAFTLVMMLYMILAYKYFVVSSFGFVFIIIICSGIFNDERVYEKVMSWGFFGNGIGSFVLAAVIGAAVLVIAGFLAYLLSLLLYRKPMSKNAVSPALRKEM